MFCRYLGLVQSVGKSEEKLNIIKHIENIAFDKGHN